MERVSPCVGDLHRFVSQRVANPSDAADITQQTLMVACEKLHTYRNGSFKGWLFAIARNLVVDHYRHQGRLRFVDIETAAVSEQESALQTASESVQEACDSRERLRCFICITQRLRLEEQVAVLLADVHGHRDKDSAGTMGISTPSFKLLLHGARNHLRQEVGATSLPGLQPVRSASNGTTTLNGHARTSRDEMVAGNQNPAWQPWALLKLQPPVTSAAPTGRAGEAAGHGGRNACGHLGQPATPGSSCVNCPMGSTCAQSEGSHSPCRLGLKCCRLVPRFRALRDRLLEDLQAGLYS